MDKKALIKHIQKCKRDSLTHYGKNEIEGKTNMLNCIAGIIEFVNKATSLEEINDHIFMLATSDEVDIDTGCVCEELIQELSNHYKEFEKNLPDILC